jgi:hypothetical protein
MLFRRYLENLHNQNWIAVALDFVVVVVGIFLAFQLERWYSDQRMQGNANERLTTLVDDFSANREELARSIGLREPVVSAAIELLELDEQRPSEDQYEHFYELLATASVTATPRLRRGAYDILIATGQIELLTDESLKSELADFYAQLDELLIYNQGTWMVDRNTFEPFIIRSLDYVEMLRRLHPDGETGNTPSQEKEQFLEVLGTAEFEGVIAAKWHAARDEIIRLKRLQERLLVVEERLSQAITTEAR